MLEVEKPSPSRFDKWQFLSGWITSFLTATAVLVMTPADVGAAPAFGLSSEAATILDTADPTEVFPSVPAAPGKVDPDDGVLGDVTLDNSVTAVNPPDTDVFKFASMAISPAGNMYLGTGFRFADAESDVFQFVPNHAYINGLPAGVTETYPFTFRDGSDAAIFTVTVTGVADTPVVTAFIPDITKGLPSNSFTCAFCTFPGGEPPPKAFDDNTGSKYLSSRGAGTDVIVDAGIDYVITALSFVTANDDDGRDPVKVSVFGSATGSSGPWSEIKTGLEISPPVARASAFGPYSFDNTAAYRYFKIVFDQLRRTGSDFQIAEISIRGTTPSGVARYTTGAPNTIIGSGISLFDDGDARTATASLPNPGSMPGDRLGLAPGTAAGVTATWDATTRTLTVTANSQADLADALKKLTFVSSEVDPTPAGLTRQISLTVTDDKGATSAVAPLSVSIQPAATPFSDPGTNELPSQDPGAFRVFQDGIPLPDVNVEVQNNSALVMSNADFEIRLSAQCTTGCAIQTDSSGRPVIELESSGSALIEGLGFQPGSFIDVWLFSTPTYLGQLQVDDDGKFSGELALPVIAAGSHTLQVNGTSADGKSRSANLGVIVRGTSSGFEFDYELPEQPTTLPDTGGSPTLGPWAAAFVLAGGFLLSIRRRRTL